MRAVKASGWDWDEGSSAAASVGAVAVMMGFKTPPEKCVGFRKIKQNAKVKCVGTCSMLGTQSPTCNWFMFTFSGLSAKLAVIRHNDTTIWARDIQNVNIILWRNKFRANMEIILSKFWEELFADDMSYDENNMRSWLGVEKMSPTYNLGPLIIKKRRHV